MVSPCIKLPFFGFFGARLQPPKLIVFPIMVESSNNKKKTKTNDVVKSTTIKRKAVRPNFKKTKKTVDKNKEKNTDNDNNNKNKNDKKNKNKSNKSKDKNESSSKKS